MSADFAHALDDGQAEFSDAAGGDVEACCEHGIRWHHPERGCGYHGYAPEYRCPCSLTCDEAVGHLLTAQRARTAAAIRAEADRICAERGCHVAGNDHAELMKWAGVFAGVVERGES